MNFIFHQWDWISIRGWNYFVQRRDKRIKVECNKETSSRSQNPFHFWQCYPWFPMVSTKNHHSNVQLLIRVIICKIKPGCFSFERILSSLRISEIYSLIQESTDWSSKCLTLRFESGDLFPWHSKSLLGISYHHWSHFIKLKRPPTRYTLTVSPIFVNIFVNIFVFWWHLTFFEEIWSRSTGKTL